MFDGACRSRHVGRLAIAISLCALAGTVHADAWLEAGDAGLRHDVEYLVDTRLIDLPLTGWPIPAVDLAVALQAAKNRASITPDQLRALTRLEQRLDLARIDALSTEAWVRGAARPIVVRTFEDTPREEAELGASIRASNARVSGRLSVRLVTDPDDDQEVRLDGTYGTVRLGNWLLTAGALDRWWGPGWDGSLLLSNNARPVPALALDRESSTPFRSPFLSWIGPWRLSTFMGKLEEHRQDRDHPLLFGMRINFRPLSNVRVGSVHPLAGIEFALERTAEWCGEGLPCNLDAFGNVFAGHDNAGETVNPKNEPGNQLAGWTLRLASPLRQVPLAFYRQKTGETIDLHSPLPRRTLDLYGMEAWGHAGGDYSWRAHFEFANTACSAKAGQTTPAFDCAYNNTLFDVEGYRYRGRPIGHSVDGDSLAYSLGVLLTTPHDRTGTFVLRRVKLNRGGVVPDVRNTLAQEPVELWNVEAAYGAEERSGSWRVGIGADQQEVLSTGRRERAIRGFVEWRLRF